MPRIWTEGGEIVPIRWSALKVSKAMDEVENQIILADGFIAEAKAKATEARKIANLPQYIDGCLARLITQLERMNYVKDAIEAVRKSIPEGAIETECDSAKYGSQQSLI
jgi:hypothetical protein